VCHARSEGLFPCQKRLETRFPSLAQLVLAGQLVRGRWTHFLPSLLVALWGPEAGAAPDGSANPSATAQGSRFELKLDAPPGCADGVETAAAIEQLVSAPGPSQPLEVSARIVRQEESWSVSISWAEGRRLIRGDSCEAVTRALVAIVALAVDASAEPSSGSRAEAQQSDLEVSSTSPVPSESMASPVRDRLPSKFGAATSESKSSSGAPAAELGASLLALAESGMLPAASYGVAGRVRLSLRAWSAELGGSWLAPRWTQVEQIAERKGGHVSWMALEADGCRAFGRRAAACAGAELGELRGQGEGVTDEYDGTSLWFAGTIAGLGRLSLGRSFSAEARAVAAFPLYRPQFYIEPYGSLHRPSWVSGRLLVGIGFR
jgi:hypothetical protein